MTIPDEYRLEDVQKVDAVLEKIYGLVDNFEEKTKLYEGYRNKILGEEGRYNSVNRSLIEVTKQMHGLSEELEQACGEKDKSHAMNTLYEMDFMMQIVRESIYAELVDMSEE